MARIVVGSYLVRYPLGGNVSCVLQYLLGLHRLGHEVYFVEKSAYVKSCYDPHANEMTDDCSSGVKIVRDVLTRFGLQDRFCYVDAQDRYHGLSPRSVEAIFRSSDLFIEMGSHEAWLNETGWSKTRILLDGDPGFSQIWIETRISQGDQPPRYDAYFTVGANVGSSRSIAPTAGERWRPYFHPVVVDLFPVTPVGDAAPFTTVMNWESYRPVEYRGESYGHKNIEFDNFLDLPSLTPVSLELAVAGPAVPRERLRRHGWGVRDGRAATITTDCYWDYIRASRGEFTVCKNGFVRMNTGWFGDRSSAYLASGRPVVMQDSGFGSRLPCGVGLFAVKDADEAAAALEEIGRDWPRHSRAAREIAVEYLDAPKVLGRLLRDVGL
jgi:hypothetical protein